MVAPVTVVLLPPIGLDEHCWDWLDLPAGPVIRHVYPGFGRRPAGPRPADLDVWADEVAALGSGEPLDLAGVSMGSMVAQHTALRHPGRVRSLLLACTGGSADPGPALARAAAAAGGMAGVLDETLRRWFTRGALEAQPAHPGVDYATRTLLDLDPASFAGGWRAIARHDVLSRLAAVTAPTTCIAASSDASAPVQRVQRLAEAIPGSRLEVLDGPHMIHLENPAAFSGALAAHLERQARIR
jgi:3-oxoadipate enol-lactonase